MVSQRIRQSSKISKTKPGSPTDLAEQFCQLKKLQKLVRDMEEVAASDQRRRGPTRAGAETDQQMSVVNLAWHNAWHVCRVFIPRRSITGKLVWGQVWRRQ